MTIPLLTDFSQTTEEQRHDLYPVYPNVSSLVDIEISVYPGRECTPSGSLQESDESMGPRKKSKPNPKAEIGSQPTTPNEIPDRGPQQAPEGLIGSAASNAENVDTCASPSEFRTPSASDTRKTWYGGTWPRTPKATPVTQVAKESILAAGAAASEIISSAQRRVSPRRANPSRNPSLYLSKGVGGSSRSLPLAATTTKLHITSNSSDTTCGKRNNAQEAISVGNGPNAGTKPESIKKSGMALSDGSPSRKDMMRSNCSDAEFLDAEGKEKLLAEGKEASFGWMGWFARPSNDKEQAIQQPVTQHREPPADQPCAIQESSDRNRANPSAAVKDLSADDRRLNNKNSRKERRNSAPDPISPAIDSDPAPRSWLGLWGYAATPAQIETPRTNNTSDDSQRQLEIAQSTNDGSSKTSVVTKTTSKTPEQSIEASKSYGWAFWTREPTESDYGGKARRTSVGELALAGSPSQSKPETAELDETYISSKPRDQGRPLPADMNGIATTVDDHRIHGNRSTKPQAAAVSTTMDKSEVPLVKSKQSVANLLLPPLGHTYRTVEKAGLLQQLGRLLQYNKPSSNARHVYLQDPPRIKTALAIGVHGYFPAPLIRSVLGQPTGTSIRFANGAANAIQQWTARQGYSCNIEKVALEGEGKIAERLELLWKLLLNWLEEIRKADFVVVACHSQGVPVAIMLISKLISFRCLNGARIGVCAMAGVNLGPFGDYKSRWISGSAGELFDFGQPDSQVSKDYEAALDVVLKFGVRITYVGSIDDQLVSLESSTFGTVSHPYIYRAVFIDGRVHAPDFLSHLVGFALRLRNLGITDHGLIRELSTPLAGSLYGGEGHSRIYDDDVVYQLAVQFALETTSSDNLSPQFSRDEPANTQNPYILPFAMRGLLEEDYVRTELRNETTELLQQFDDWKPSSKVLKDVKFRLEGVRSKL